MKTLTVTVCCYRNGPDAEKRGILLRNAENATLIDVGSLETIEIDEDTVVRELTEEGCFSLLHSFSPELRKAVKESRRMARVDPDEEAPKAVPTHRSRMRCGPK